jgi:hypothetical protein
MGDKQGTTSILDPAALWGRILRTTLNLRSLSDLACSQQLTIHFA